jgi:hypothetical protein
MLKNVAHKIYQMATNNTKLQRKRPNGHKIYPHLPLQDHPKFTQIGIFFGLKICHLATLQRSQITQPATSSSITLP